MKTITLPLSKSKISLEEKITLRMQEDLALAEYRFDNGEKRDRIVNLQKGIQYRKREAIVMICKSSKDSEGKDIEMNHDFLQNLEIEDFLFLQEAVEEIYKKKADFLKKKNLPSDLR